MSEEHLDWTQTRLLDQADTIYSSCFVFTDPELDKEESVVRPFFIQLLQASFLLGELVVNLPHIYRLQHGIIVAWV